jgi:ppGpp synthetase/RelA/SpoT-type nucleotidyltranferase
MANGGLIEVGKIYLIGRPEISIIGRFGKKSATYKTIQVDESGNKIVNQQTFFFRGSAKNINFGEQYVKVTQKDFDSRFLAQNKMANGGMAKVQILNEDEVFDKDKYKAILDDFDMDGLPNVDDPEPLKKGKNKGSVEQVQLANTFKKVLNVKQDLNIELSDFVKKLQQSAPEKSVIYGRTKTPYSILNKLVDSRLLDEKRGLKDLVGTTIAFDDIRDLQKFTEKTRKGFYGEVIDFDDFYSAPKDGYRAYHFIVKQNEVPIELQLKTKRMKDVNVLSHDAYKKKNLNTDFMLYLTTLADQADRGNKAAQVEFSKLMTNKAQVENQLNN